MSDPSKKAEKIAAKAKPQQVAMDPERPNDRKMGEMDRPFNNNDPAEAVNTKGELGPIAEQFPTDGLNARDPADEVMDMKYELQQRVDPETGDVVDTGVTPFGEMTWDDKYAEYLLRKEEAARKAEFQQWFARKYDLMDHAQKKAARELFPQFYAERQAMASENLDAVKRLVQVKIDGIKSKEDLALMYAADRGMLPIDVYRNILFPELAVNEREAQFQRGLFNTNKFMGTRREGLSAREAADATQGYSVPNTSTFLRRGYAGRTQVGAYANQNLV